MLLLLLLRLREVVHGLRRLIKHAQQIASSHVLIDIVHISGCHVLEDIAIVHIVHLLLILLLLGQTLDILGNIICRAPCEIVVALLGCLDEITEVGGIGKVVGIIGSVVIVIPHHKIMSNYSFCCCCC